MQKYSYLIIMVFISLVFLSGCGNGEETGEIVDNSKIQMKDGLFYKIGENKPFTGKVVSYYKNGQKEFEIDHKDGKRHGQYISWLKDGKKDLELTYINGNVDLNKRLKNRK